jgi:ribosomal protein S13
MFQEFEKTSFQFEHCWNVLRCQPIWIKGKKKSRKRIFPTTFSPTLDLINLEEDDSSTNHFVDLEIPLGKKVGNELLNEPISENSEREMEVIEETSIQEQKRLRSLHEHELERLRFKQEKLQEEQVREEDKLMLMDTSGLSEVQKEYIHQRQMEILENRLRK